MYLCAVVKCKCCATVLITLSLRSNGYCVAMSHTLLRPQSLLAFPLGNVPGKWLSIGPYDVPMNSRMATIRISHDRQLRDVNSLYAVAAAVTVADRPNIAKTYAVDMQCVTNSHAMQTVAYMSQRLAHIAVWPLESSLSPVFTCAQLNLDVENISQALYQIRRGHDAYVFTMSHPDLAQSKSEFDTEKHSNER